MSLILLDFDGTITQTDSISALIHSAIAHSPFLDPTTANQTWDGIANAWLADYEKHVASYAPKRENRTDAAAELAFLESLKGLERASVKRVEGADLFRGLEDEKFVEMGRKAVESGEVKVRRGFMGFMGELEERGWKTGVVSVNWSLGWVTGAMGWEVEGGELVNQIGGTEGRIEGPARIGFGRERMMLTAEDKLEAARVLVEENKAKGGSESWVYVGDSTTDLACLLDADMGIVMAEGDESSLLQTLKRIGFEVPHVGECPSCPKLVWARDFEEVLQSAVMYRLEDL